MVHRIHVEELVDHLCAKGVTCSSGTQGKLVAVAVGIAPDEICHGTFVRYLSEAVDDFDLVYAVYARAQSSVDAEYAVVDDAGQRQIVKHVGEVMPYCCVAVFPAAFCVEAI